MTAAPTGTAWRSTNSGMGDPVPYSVKALKLPQGMVLEPGGAGQFEGLVNKHRISAGAAQELADVHFDHLKRMQALVERQRTDAYSAEQRRFLAERGARDKVAAAKSLLDQYEKVRGRSARDAVVHVLEKSGAAHYGPVIELMAFAAGPNKHGGLSKAARRYSSPVHTMLARFIEVIEAWLGKPAYAASREEVANG